MPTMDIRMLAKRHGILHRNVVESSLPAKYDIEVFIALDR
jgi:hypothetical protein